jgi:hypothetical protein
VTAGEADVVAAGQMTAPTVAPWSDPNTWLYWCDRCGLSRITGAELGVGPIIHIVPAVELLAGPGQQLIRNVRHGGS